MPSIAITFMKDKYLLFEGMLCSYFIIPESSKAYSINYRTSINPFLDFTLVLRFRSNTQVFPSDYHLQEQKLLPVVEKGRSQPLLNARGWCHGRSGLVQLTDVPGQRSRDVCRAVNTECGAELNLDWKWSFCLLGLVSSAGVFLLIKLPYGPQFWQLIFACLEAGSSIWLLLLSATGYLLPTVTHATHTYRNDAIVLLYQLLLISATTFVGLICLGIIYSATNIESKNTYIQLY